VPTATPALCLCDSTATSSTALLLRRRCNTAPGQLRRGGTLAANRPGARQRLTKPPYDSRCDKGNRADGRSPPALLDSAGAVLCSALRDVLLSAIASVVVVKEQHSIVPSAPCPGRLQIERRPSEPSSGSAPNQHAVSRRGHGRVFAP
jgi:hypothetical protein